MTLNATEAACSAAELSIIAAYHPTKDLAPAGCKTLILLGPEEPGFWRRITTSPEFGGPDPVDRWSERVINDLASKLDARAVFPFGGPPHKPFVGWALASGQVWQSPVNLLIHDIAGLFLSFRGALVFDTKLELPEAASANPCDTCRDKPCLTACPAHALTAAGYDVPACHRWLDQNTGKACLSGGCLVRRSCPVSQTYGRLAEQSAHHMRYFHKG